jgi:hypothetical protein
LTCWERKGDQSNECGGLCLVTGVLPQCLLRVQGRYNICVKHPVSLEVGLSDIALGGTGAPRRCLVLHHWETRIPWDCSNGIRVSQ